eukprot:104332_1
MRHSRCSFRIGLRCFMMITLSFLLIHGFLILFSSRYIMEDTHIQLELQLSHVHQEALSEPEPEPVHVFLLNESLYDCFHMFHSHLDKSNGDQGGWNLSNINTIQHLPHECHINTNETHQISFIIIDIFVGKFLKIESLNAFDFGAIYLIKVNKHICRYKPLPFQEYDNFKEYKTMKHLSQIDGIKNHTINVYDQYPFINWTFDGIECCIIVMQYLEHTIPISDFVPDTLVDISFETLLANCYTQINAVLDELWTYDLIIHNDLYADNILMDLDSKAFTCYLIDFEFIFEYKQILTANIIIRSFMHHQSPLGWYYLWNKRTRRQFIIQQYDNKDEAKDQLIDYGYKVQKYKLLCIFLDVYTRYIMQENDTLRNTYNHINTERFTQMMAGKLFNRMNKRDYSIDERKLIQIWTSRTQQIKLVIEILNDKLAMTLKDIFAELAKELQTELQITSDVEIVDFSFKG